jgi:hypothetical protein
MQTTETESTALLRSCTGTVGSNPAKGFNISQHLNIGYCSVWYVAKFKYLGRTNQNYMHEEITKTRKLGECLSLFSAEYFLPVSYLETCRLKQKKNIYIILSIVLYWCETWFLTLAEDLGSWGTKRSGKLLNLREGMEREVGENCIRSFIICTFRQILFRQTMMRWAGNVERMGEMRNAYKVLCGESKGS